MDGIAKLKLMAEDTRYEAAEDADGPLTNDGLTAFSGGCVPQPERCFSNTDDLPIYQAALPGGRRMPLLKTLLSSACERNCNYCCFRAGRDFRRAVFSPDEMAKTYLSIYRTGRVKGIFLSSGVVGGGICTQDKLIATAEILRRMGYRDYLHLKIMPGSEFSQVERAMQLADRVSINLEGPNTASLARLAPMKNFVEELLQPLKWIEQIRASQPAQRGWQGRWPSSATQFVVGAAGESDLELLGISTYLLQNLHLRRVYFSRFNPVADTPLENLPAENPWRQHRLYQASFLLRDYGFDLEDLPLQPDGSLPLEVDPKVAWAREHLSNAPMEINSAELHELLKIPGIGQKSARAIIQARRKNPLRRLDDLRFLGISANRAAPFILLNGVHPSTQLRLF